MQMMPGLILELLASGAVVITIPFLMFVFSMFLLRACNQSTSLAATFPKHEGEKRRAYEELVREVERGSFTPLV